MCPHPTFSILIVVEKTFTRKLNVPRKHIVHLAEPCDTPPSLSIKHLYVALLKIVQADITDEDIQDQMKETLRLVEKSASGNENILTATIEWLTYMDPKHPPPSDGIGVASQLIDWAAATTVCRDELDANIEELKLLKSETAGTMKTLRTRNPTQADNDDMENGRKRRRNYIKNDFL